MALGAGRRLSHRTISRQPNDRTGYGHGPTIHTAPAAGSLRDGRHTGPLGFEFRKMRSVVQGKFKFVPYGLQIEFGLRILGLCDSGLVQSGPAGEELVEIDFRGNEADPQFAPRDPEIFVAGRAGEVVVKTHISAFVALHSTPPGVPFDLGHLEQQYHELLD